MRIPNHPTLIQRMLQSRLRRLGSATPILAATLVCFSRRCRKPSCRCHHGEPVHTSQHVTCQEHGRTRSVYVPKDLIPEVRTWIARHRQLKELLKEIHQLSLALIRNHSQHQRRKAGRP